MVERTPDGIYERTFDIRLTDCDQENRMTWASLFSMSQHTSDYAMAPYGVSADHLKEQGLGWMIVGCQLRFYRPFPAAGQTLQTRTWCKGLKGARAIRESSFWLSNGTSKQLVAAGNFEWIIVHLTDRHIIHPDSVLPSSLTGEGGEIIRPQNQFSMRLPHMGVTVPLDEASNGSCYSHIEQCQALDVDRNGHMNHTVYLRMAQNAFAEYLTGRRITDDQNLWITGMRVYYKQEIRLKERVTVLLKECRQLSGDTQITLSIWNLESSVLAAQVELDTVLGEEPQWPEPPVIEA